MKTKMTNTRKFLLGTILALATPFALPTALRAADHGDGPTAANDQACDIADVFFFLDPNDNTKAIIIGTVRGFIVPSEAVNFGIFDPNVRYRFQIENTGNAIPDKTIDVTFSKRTSTSSAQTATIKISGVPGKFTAPATNPTLAGTPNAQVVTPLTVNGSTVNFFAGEVDDPFFFDIPAFSRVIGSILATPPAPNTSFFSRGRDSFAGYNIMSIAFSVPVALLKGPGANAPTTLGLNFVTQRRTIETPTKKGETLSIGEFRPVDRMGIPAVNVALVPFDTKNKYNAGSTKDDKNGKFIPAIGGTLDKLLTGLGKSPADKTKIIGTLASVAIANGDLLRLETNATAKPNTGTGGGVGPNGFPNGRRLKDDTIDIILSIIADGPLGDNVNASDVAPTNAFPFLAPPQQPRDKNADPLINADDNTRN